MINELRIGNWVRIDDMPPEQITLEIFAMLKGYPFHISKFQPITLSPELLEKCGFEKFLDGYSILFGEDENTAFGLNWDAKDGFTLGQNHETFYIRRIEYLHQLQNLYFALTGEELEIKELTPSNNSI